jgi:hypothetical protein
MKNLGVRCLGLLILFLSVSGYGQPPIPAQFFYFPTNFETAFGAAPLASTANLISAPVDTAPYYGNALILDTTNLTPSYLAYNIIDTSPRTNRNFSYTAGTAFWIFSPNWSSFSQGGTGPGEKAYFVAGGDWNSNSPNGLFAIYADAAGSNIYFGGVEAGVAVTYASAPISWSSNSIHQISAEWTTGDCELYADGAMVATGNGVTIVPARSTWTNGFFIGSDGFGYEQSRGATYAMFTWTEEYGGWYTNGWLSLSNTLATWQAAQGAGGFGGMMGLGSGSLTGGGGSTNSVTGTNVYLANMSALPDANGDGGMTFQFSIEGGTNGMAYDVFATTNLWFGNITNGVWNWLGQGTNGGTYAITNQTTNQQFYVLGGTLAPDGSGLTVAYENLISHGAWSDGYGTPLAWYIWQGLNPQTPGIATQDIGQDGLANWQKYLYGANPLVSEGFAVWVGAPNGTSAIP